jgi:ATP-dependent Lon protease
MTQYTLAMVVLTRHQKRPKMIKQTYPNKKRLGKPESPPDSDDDIEDIDDFIDDNDDSEYGDDDDEEDGKYKGETLKYFNSLGKDEQDEITRIEERLISINTTDVPLRFKVLKSDIDENLKAKIIFTMDQLDDMHPSSSEYHKKQEYVKSLCTLPIGKYKPLPVNKNSSSSSEIAKFLCDSRDKLNNIVFGHEEAKEKIVRLLAQWISNPDSKGLVIGIDGPMGCGKTTLIKEGICKVLGLPFGFVPLGGCSDGSFLTGHSYTYEGSKCGKICDVLKETGAMNTIFYFDELDKVSSTHHGDEIINVLIHMTDPSQSELFNDKYFTNVPIDLSRSLIIFSFNNAELINPILRDRMTVIKTYEYGTSQKLDIASGFLVPELNKQYNFDVSDIIFTNDILRYIINNKSDEEKGVRNLKRALNEIFGYVNYKCILQENTALIEGDLMLPITLTEKLVDFIIPKKKTTNSSHQSMYV